MELSSMFEITFIAGYLKCISFGEKCYCVF